MVPRFPVLSQSFVLTEFDRVRREVPAEIAALFSSREPVVHPIAAELLPSVIFVPLASFSTIRSNVRWLMRRPARYLSTLGRALRGSFRCPAGGMARGAVVFVKAVALMDKVIDLRATHIHAHFIHHPATAAWVINRLSRDPFQRHRPRRRPLLRPGTAQGEDSGCRSRRDDFRVQPPVHPRADPRSVRASGHPLRDLARALSLPSA